MKYLKNITDAMAALRPEDSVEFAFNNKFAVVRSRFTDGYYSTPSIAYLHNNKIFFLCIDATATQRVIQHWALRPNTEKILISFNHGENGKPNHYLIKTADHRPLKKVAKKLQRVLISNPPTLADMKFDAADDIYVIKQRTSTGLINNIYGSLQFFDDGMFDAAVCDDFGYYEDKMFDNISSGINWIKARVKELVAESESESEFAYITDITTLL